MVEFSGPANFNSKQLELLKQILTNRGFEFSFVAGQAGRDIKLEWKNATSEIPSIQLNHDLNAKYGKM